MTIPLLKHLDGSLARIQYRCLSLPCSFRGLGGERDRERERVRERERQRERERELM